MLWCCRYEALPGVRAADLARRFLRGHDAGTNAPARLRGWYGFPTGTAGMVLVEADAPGDVAAVVRPYASLMSWRVDAAAELNYNQVLEELRRGAQQAVMDDAMAGRPPAGITT
jgi:hypothetical protein